jgi:hypothetical protein
VGLVVFYRPILSTCGGFLAPSEDGKAEAVILEGTQVILEEAIKEGKTLLINKKADHLIVVLHQNATAEKLFALPVEYPQLVNKAMQQLGLKKDQWLVLEVPVIHPITLTEAKFVIAKLSEMKIRRAFLLSEGFHMRRSIKAYRQEGKKVGIRILPHPYYFSYQKENWWLTTEGVRAFVTETLKLGYYLLRGYVPVWR